MDFIRTLELFLLENGKIENDWECSDTFVYIWFSVHIDSAKNTFD